MIDNKNQQIDELLKMRSDGMKSFAVASRGLSEMGVKISDGEGFIGLPDNYSQHVEKFNNSNLEFEWEVEYSDGLKLAQFQGEDQHHFGHIDISKLKSISLISNFDWPTDNIEKRIIVRLNWETGLFDIVNGWAAPEVMAHAAMNPINGNRKLILFSRKRQSSTVGEIDEKYIDYFPAIGENFYYNRFIIGYEVSGSGMKALIICPNGEINIFEK